MPSKPSKQFDAANFHHLQSILFHVSQIPVKNAYLQIVNLKQDVQYDLRSLFKQILRHFVLLSYLSDKKNVYVKRKKRSKNCPKFFPKSSWAPCFLKNHTCKYFLKFSKFMMKIRHSQPQITICHLLLVLLRKPTVIYYLNDKGRTIIMNIKRNK